MKQPVLTDLFVVAVEQIPSYEEKNHTRVDSFPSDRTWGSTASTNEVIRSCQCEGRKHGDEHKSFIRREMMSRYVREQAHGDGWTDQEMADRLGVDRCVINARRAELPGIEALFRRKNPATGLNNTVWGLK